MERFIKVLHTFERYANGPAKANGGMEKAAEINMKMKMKTQPQTCMATFNYILQVCDVRRCVYACVSAAFACV